MLPMFCFEEFLLNEPITNGKAMDNILPTTDVGNPVLFEIDCWMGSKLLPSIELNIPDPWEESDAPK